MVRFRSGVIGVHAARLVELVLEEDLEFASILLPAAANVLVHWMTYSSAIMKTVVSSG